MTVSDALVLPSVRKVCLYHHRTRICSILFQWTLVEDFPFFRLLIHKVEYNCEDFSVSTVFTALSPILKEHGLWHFKSPAQVNPVSNLLDLFANILREGHYILTFSHMVGFEPTNVPSIHQPLGYICYEGFSVSAVLTVPRPTRYGNLVKNGFCS